MKKYLLFASVLVVFSIIFMSEFKQKYLPEVKPNPLSNLEQTGGEVVLKQGDFNSPNYRKGETGWKLNSRGGVEFSGGLEMGKSFIINRRAGTVTPNNVDDVFEIFPQLPAPTGGNNYIFIGRKGNASTSNTYRVILNAENFIEFDVNGGSVMTVNNSDITPTVDNVISNGTASLRWADVRSVLINGADIGFENGWKFREWPAKKEDVGKPVEWMKENANLGIQLLDDDENLIAVFHKNGTLYTNDIKPLSELNKSSDNSRNFLRSIWTKISSIF